MGGECLGRGAGVLNDVLQSFLDHCQPMRRREIWGPHIQDKKCVSYAGKYGICMYILIHIVQKSSQQINKTARVMIIELTNGTMQ